MHPAEYLYSLPGPIQERLVELVRTIAGLSDHEKATALGAMTGVAEAYFQHPTNGNMASVQAFGAMGQVIAEIHRAGSLADQKEVA